MLADQPTLPIRMFRYDRAWYLNVLREPELLDRAIDAGDGDLLVPISAYRKGGHSECAQLVWQTRIVELISVRPNEFPNPRVVDNYLVMWGDDVPHASFWESITLHGHHFGYSDVAIQECVNRLVKLSEEQMKLK